MVSIECGQTQDMNQVVFTSIQQDLTDYSAESGTRRLWYSCGLDSYSNVDPTTTHIPFWRIRF